MRPWPYLQAGHTQAGHTMIKSTAKKRVPKADLPGCVSSKAGARKAACQWILELFIAGQTPRSEIAFLNLKRICEEHLAGQCRIDVVDLLKHPKKAAVHQILIIPTLVRLSPRPVRKVMGDLSDTQRVLAGLDIPLTAQ